MAIKRNLYRFYMTMILIEIGVRVFAVHIYTNYMNLQIDMQNMITISTCQRTSWIYRNCLNLCAI